jgi:O-antigen/teichoic acid export membrane protein
VIGGVSAHLYAQAVTILTQLVSLPIFLYRWTPAEYGAWLTISTIPAYLALADMGVLTQVGNSMTMSRARGDLVELNRAFSASMRLLTFLLPVIGVVTLGVICLSLGSLSTDHALAILFLSISALITAGSQLFDAGYRSFGKYPLVTFLLTTTRVVEWGFSLIALFVFGTISSVAFGNLLGRVISMVAIYIYTRKEIPELEWSLKNSTNREAISSFKEGFGFLAFPVGNALNLQGTILIINWLLGPVAVAIFSATRTVTRLITQTALLTGKALSPEVSHLYGEGKIDQAKALTLRVFKVVMPVSIIASVGLAIFGTAIISKWSHSQMTPNGALLNWLILTALVSAVWQMRMVELTATNNQDYVATAFAVTSVVCTAACILAIPPYGLNGVGACLLGGELLMIVATQIGLRRMELRASVSAR